MLSTESRMRGDMQVRFGGRYGKPTAERQQGVLYRAYLLRTLLLALFGGTWRTSLVSRYFRFLYDLYPSLFFPEF